MEAFSWCIGNDFKRISTHLHRYATYRFAKSVRIENPYTAAARTRFVQPGKIEIDANERVVIGSAKAAFSFAPPSILSLTICLIGLYHRDIDNSISGCPAAWSGGIWRTFPKCRKNVTSWKQGTRR